MLIKDTRSTSKGTVGIRCLRVADEKLYIFSSFAGNCTAFSSLVVVVLVLVNLPAALVLLGGLTSVWGVKGLAYDL